MRPQVCKFLRLKYKRKIIRELFAVSLKLFLQPLGLNAIDFREVGIQHHALSTKDMDHRDQFFGNCCCFTGHINALKSHPLIYL